MTQANVPIMIALSIRFDPAEVSLAAAQLAAVAEVRKGVEARFRKAVRGRKIKADRRPDGKPELGCISIMSHLLGRGTA